MFLEELRLTKFGIFTILSLWLHCAEKLKGALSHNLLPEEVIS